MHGHVIVRIKVKVREPLQPQSFHNRPVAEEFFVEKKCESKHVLYLAYSIIVDTCRKCILTTATFVDMLF